VLAWYQRVRQTDRPMQSAIICTLISEPPACLVFERALLRISLWFCKSWFDNPGPRHWMDAAADFNVQATPRTASRTGEDPVPCRRRSHPFRPTVEIAQNRMAKASPLDRTADKPTSGPCRPRQASFLARALAADSRWAKNGDRDPDASSGLLSFQKITTSDLPWNTGGSGKNIFTLDSSEGQWTIRN
jgi:hypothetical protein